MLLWLPAPTPCPQLLLLRFTYAQIPLREQAYLLLGVAALDHAHDKVVVLFLIFLAGLGVEADDRKQVLGVGEHFLLDHHAQLRS